MTFTDKEPLYSLYIPYFFPFYTFFHRYDSSFQTTKFSSRNLGHYDLSPNCYEKTPSHNIYETFKFQVASDVEAWIYQRWGIEGAKP